MFKTPLCDLLGIKYPIIQGGMAWIATAELAAAVSNGGGLGIIGAGNMPPEMLRNEIIKARQLTDKPFGVNAYYMSPYVEEVIQVIIEEKVSVITTGAGNPGKHISALKEAGTKVIPVVASVALAKRLERLGVDALIAEGMECGGHIGEITTMALLPQVVDAVSIPVIGAGGIADGRGVVAALSLGAEGVQIGTRFVCASECTVHPNYKKAIIKAKERGTAVTGEGTSHRVRIIDNKLAKEIKKETLETDIETALQKWGGGSLRRAAREGDIDMGSVMAGQIAGMVSQEMSAAEMIQEMMTEAETVTKRLSGVCVR